jgi:hypothetical protein
MAERRPIYSAQATGQQIGYIEDDEAFDLFDRPCAIYDSNTGLLRNSKNNAVVGYVTLADIFVGSSWMAQELFSKTGPVTPQANLEEQGDEDSEAAVCGAEDGNAQNVDTVRLIARAPPSHHAAKNELFVAPIPVDSEKASAEEHASHASDITTFASSPQQHKVIDTVLAPPTSPLLGDSASEQPARPQDASDAGKGFASGEPGSGDPSRTMGETAPALHTDDDGNVPMPASSDEGAFESAPLEEPPSGDGMAPSVDWLVRHLTEYIHSSNHRSATPPSSSCASGTENETAPALAPDAYASATMPVPSNESAFESAPPDVPPGGKGMPPAVAAFMRHLTEYVDSNNAQTATLPSDDAAEVKLSSSAETQKDMDRVPLPAEPDPEGESSGSAPHSGLTGVDREQTEDCPPVRMDSPVELGQDTHQERNSAAAKGAETNDASPDVFSTDMDRILRAVWREAEKNTDSA